MSATDRLVVHLKSDSPSPPSVVATAIREGAELEENQVERIKDLNSRALTLFSYLVGGTSVFTGLTALLSFFDFGASDAAVVDVSFFQYLIQSNYFRFGLVFFFTSLLFASLAAAPYRYRRGADNQDLSHVRYGVITEGEQWQREVLETQVQNLRANGRTIRLKVHIVFGSILTLLFAIALFGIGLLVGVSLLRSASAGATYEITARPTYPVPGYPLFLAFLVAVLVTYFPIHVRTARWDPAEHLVDLRRVPGADADEAGIAARFATALGSGLSRSPSAIGSGLVGSLNDHFEFVPFSLITVQLVGLLLVFHGDVIEPMLPPRLPFDYLPVAAVAAVVLGLLLSLGIHVLTHRVQEVIDAETFETTATSGGKLALRNNTGKPLVLDGWCVERHRVGDDVASSHTFPAGSRLSRRGVLTVPVRSLGERPDSHDASDGDIDLSDADFSPRQVVSRVLIKDDDWNVVQKFWLFGERPDGERGADSE